MEFNELIKKAEEVTRLYDQLNESQGFPKWELEQHTEGLVEDVGSLMRLVMMKSGRRARFDDLDEKLRHEVCDCLWSVIKIAQSLEIDLEQEFPQQMEKLAIRVKEEKH